MIALAQSPLTPAEPKSAEVIEALRKTVSPSRLTLFLQCRLKFWFRHVAKIQKSRTASLHVGGVAHAVLKAWNKARWRKRSLSPTELHDEFTKAWVDEGADQVQWDGDEQVHRMQAWRLVETYIRESRIPPERRPDAVEVPVEADLRHHGLPILKGILDLVEAGLIVDYKTSGQTPHAEKSAHVHETQTTCYALLYRETTGKREAGIEIHTLVKLKAPKLVIASMPPMSDGQRSRVFRLMEAYEHGLDVRDFVPSPGMQCVSCEFFNECRAWH